MSTLHTKSFPGESPEYRQARDELLQAERDLRRQLEAVAAQRRRLPPGGPPPTDYVFESVNGESVRLGQLFGDRDTLLLYNWMYGPNQDHPCPMCSSFLDAWNANARFLRQRVAMAIVGRSPAERLGAFARSRGWHDLPVLSSARNTFNRDYFGEDDDGSQQPMLHVFVRKDGQVRHFWSSELLYAPTDPGQDPRHIDLGSPLWSLLDLTPGGRGQWYPGL
jgi:predicted dithiol-disulfide oxidoreductase (DUF899 family)